MDKPADADIHAIRILVVDDEPFTRKVVRRVLTDLKFSHVDEAENGDMAVTQLEKQTFDLIITDVQMPGMNGLELVRRIRVGLTAAAADTRTIILTSFSNTEVLGISMALEVNGFLVKPMKPAVVEAKIAQAMNEDRQNVRPPIAYQSINTDLRTIRSQAKNLADHEHGTVNASLLRNDECEWTRVPRHQVAIAQLEPGLRLAQQVMTADGFLLLSVGHVLTGLNINRLNDLRSVLTDELIWIVDDVR